MRKPMLAYKDPSVIQFPCWASPKIDGIRALVHGGVVYSRTLKPIPNPHVQEMFGRDEFEGFDGELVVGSATAKNCMQATNSGVMSETGTPDVAYYVFDLWDEPTLNFESRYANLVSRAPVRSCGVIVLEHIKVLNIDELNIFEAAMLEHGFEGAMANNPLGMYKEGRAGKRGWELVKIKRFEDGEAFVIGFEERMHNDNEKTVDNLGHSKRSTHQANKRAAGDLGALVCHQVIDGKVRKDKQFNIGTGFTAEQRHNMWANRSSLLGKVVTFKHFAVTGVVDVPRIPVFKAFRDTRDL